MKPRGTLMIEHRLIEKVLKMVKEKALSSTSTDFSPVFIDTVVDFIRTYADRTHHGKEEDILFVALEKKKMDAENTAIMKELVSEHTQARAKVKELVGLNEQYREGDRSVAPRMVKILLWLTDFYPEHIRKEDARFFPDTEKYFSRPELDAMLEDFWEFDRSMIHEKYQNVLSAIRQQLQKQAP